MYDARIPDAILSISKSIESVAHATNRLAKAQEDANEIEKRKVVSHSLTTVYLDEDCEGADE